MAQVLIRNLDAKIVDKLKERARRNGRSLEAELRVILEREAGGRANSVGESAPRYRTQDESIHDVIDRIATRSSSITPPKERGPMRPIKPIKMKGKPLSEMIIEDRE